jgi:hypothetical protein
MGSFRSASAGAGRSQKRSLRPRFGAAKAVQHAAFKAAVLHIHSMRLVEGIPNASRARSTEAFGAARHLAGPCGMAPASSNQ